MKQMKLTYEIPEGLDEQTIAQLGTSVDIEVRRLLNTFWTDYLSQSLKVVTAEVEEVKSER